MIARFQDRPAVRRLAALALLALTVWIVLPPLFGPVQAWREARAALESERAIAERQARLAARRGAVAALAAQPDLPFVVAPDAAAAALTLVQRLNAAAPADAMRLSFDAPQPFDERPGAPVPLRFAFEATEGALYAFLAEIETGKPFLRVDEMQAARVRDSDGTITLTGTAAVSAVPLLRAQP